MPSHSLRTVISYLRRATGPACGDPEDAELLARYVATRDEAAFDALVRRHGPLVYGACRRLLDDSNDADDVFQATFVVLARRAASIRKRESVGAWLYGVAFRIARRARSRAARRREQEMQAVPIQTTQHEPAWNELQPILDEELMALPEKYRVPLVLCYLEGRTWDEVARVLGWPRGSMSRRLEKARELLRVRLARRGLALSWAAFLGLLTCQPLSAAVPALLHTTTLQTAASSALPTALIPLVHGEIQHMAFAKMKMVFALALSLVVLGSGAGWLVFRNTTVAAPAPAEVKAPDIKLPADPKAAVITLDHQGGRIRRVRDEPRLLIRADGAIIVGDPFGLGGRCESKMSARELQDLLHFIIKDRDFFNIDSAKIRQAVADEVKKSAGGIKVGDGQTSIFRVEADGRNHEVSYYALDTYASYYKNVKELGRLRDIQARLERIRSVAVAGGSQAIAQDLKLANESLQKEHPKVAPLTLDDLQHVARTREGKTVLTFFRKETKDDGFARVDISRMEKEKSQVWVKVGEQKATPKK
jgi:RNA polymerase sigma factor (sigma-70 family)